MEGLKSDLKGYRAFRTRNGRYLHIYFKSGRSFTVRDYRDNRPLFRIWISDVPDLIAIEKAAYERALLDNPAFGMTGTRRARNVALSKGIAIALSAVGLGLAVLMFIWPEPMEPAFWACVAWPLAMMVVTAMSAGRFGIFNAKGTARVRLDWAWMAPMAGMAFRAMQTAAIPGATELISAGIVATGLFLVVTAMMEKRAPRQMLVALAAVLLWSWSGYEIGHQVYPDSAIFAVQTSH